MVSALAEPPEDSPAFIRLSLYYAMLFMVNGIVFPYLQVILRGMGFSKTEVGGLIGIAQLIAVSAPPVWGAAADLARRRRLVLILAIGGGGALFCLLPLSGRLSVAALLVVAYYAFREGVIPLSDGLTFAHLGERRDAYGRVRAWGSLGFVVSAAGMAWLGAGTPGRMHLLFAAYALFCCGQLLLALFLPDAWAGKARRRKPQSPFPWRRLLTRPSVIAFVFAAFMARATMMGYYSLFSLYLRDRFHVQGVGYLWALGPIAEIPVIFFSGWMIRRMGLKGLLLLGLAGVTVRLAIYSRTNLLAVVVAAQALHCLTFGAVHVASVNFVDRIVPPALKATGQSLFAAIVVGIGGLSGSAVAGWLADRWSYAAMYGTLSAAAAVGLLAAAVFIRPSELGAGGPNGRAAGN